MGESGSHLASNSVGTGLPRREANSSSSSSTELKMGGIITSLLHTTSWHRDSFTNFAKEILQVLLHFLKEKVKTNSRYRNLRNGKFTLNFAFLIVILAK
jgi:hypothetical protein